MGKQHHRKDDVEGASKVCLCILYVVSWCVTFGLFEVAHGAYSTLTAREPRHVGGV